MKQNLFAKKKVRSLAIGLLASFTVHKFFSILVLLLPSQLQYSPLNPRLKYPEAFFYVYGSVHR